MKPVMLAFNGTELDILADGLNRVLREAPGHRSDQWIRQLLELGLRFRELGRRPGGWIDLDVLDVKWTVPYLRKALADASETPTLRLKVKNLEVLVKQLQKPKPRPKPRPKKKLPVKVLPHAPATATVAAAGVTVAPRGLHHAPHTIIKPLPRAVEKGLDAAFGTPEP